MGCKLRLRCLELYRDLQVNKNDEPRPTNDVDAAMRAISEAMRTAIEPGNGPRYLKTTRRQTGWKHHSGQLPLTATPTPKQVSLRLTPDNTGD
jgi:hypothetical protein